MNVFCKSGTAITIPLEAVCNLLINGYLDKKIKQLIPKPTRASNHLEAHVGVQSKDTKILFDFNRIYRAIHLLSFE